MKSRKESISVIKTIETVFLEELKEIVYFDKAPYIKFLLIIQGIEYLGACLDELPFTSEKRSEERFNKALKKLFDKIYHKYANKNAKVYFYQDLRCGMIHQFRVNQKKITFTTRKDANDIFLHLEKDQEGRIVFILEDFYEDFAKACQKTILLFKNKKLTNKKGEEEFITITHYEEPFFINST